MLANGQERNYSQMASQAAEPKVYFTKDDASHETKVTYYILLIFFFVLACIGFVNVCFAMRIRKFSKPIVTFYLVSELVIVLRMTLFTDPFVKWGDVTYVVLLVSMPSYLYLLVGLSQVMLTFESIIKLKNFKIREQQTISNADLKIKMKRNKRFLDGSYFAIYIMLFIIIAFFTSAEVFCVMKHCDFEGSYFGPLYLAIFNIVVWFMLALSTFVFVRMLNNRFGETEFTGPKIKFFTFLTVFSLSFAIRGSWDLGLLIKPIEIT